MIEQLFNLLAPHLCIKCKKTGTIFCTSCLDSLPLPRSHCYRCRDVLRIKDQPSQIACKNCIRQIPLDTVLAVTTYESHAAQLVQRLKYERAAAAARVIAHAIAAACAGISSGAVVTYAPTAAKRVRIRGYDQAALIARHLAQELGLPCRPLLRRIGRTRQVGASKQQREEQARQAFLARSTKMPEAVILIDDVITTGATLEAAAAALKRSGVERVVVATFAAA